MTVYANGGESITNQDREKVSCQMQQNSTTNGQNLFWLTRTSCPMTITGASRSLVWSHCRRTNSPLGQRSIHPNKKYCDKKSRARRRELRSLPYGLRPKRVFPELFTFESKKLHDLLKCQHLKLSYDHYRQISVSRLKPEQKNELRAWAEKHQSKLREPSKRSSDFL